MQDYLFSICSFRFNEIIEKIEEFDRNNQVNKFKKIICRLLYIQGRLEKVITASPYLISKKCNLIF